ncbi:MAG: sulfatase-like hydrolase/transferase [Planctomycetota bacterium]
MASRDPSRPNLLVILTDDQGAWALGCAGNDEIRTPNLDRLAATGIRCHNFFCVSPVCSPARASLLTGRIPSQHGVHDWLCGGNNVNEGELIAFLRGQPGYSDHLAAAGYRCGLAGKWHLGDAHHPQKGFTFWRAHAAGGGPYYNAPWIDGDRVVRSEDYVTDVITDHALEFLDGAAGDDAPFCLDVHYTAPHSPYGRDQHPAATFDDYHANCAFASIPDVPPHPWMRKTAQNATTPEARQEMLSGYFTAVTEMDRCVGRLLDRLEAAGLRESTLIFFTSDNGMSMGHHGIWGKGNGTMPLNMYDTAVKVPALLSQPGVVPEGVVNTDLLSHYDWMPTLLDHLGLPHPEADALPGRSFAPVLRGEALGDGRPVIVFDEYGPVRMVRTQAWKYVHRTPYGPHELYDLEHDPDETTNLYGHESHADRVAELRGQLRQWFDRYVDPARDGSREPVTGSGQHGRAGAESGGRDAFAQGWAYGHPEGKPRSAFPVFDD